MKQQIKIAFLGGDRRQHTAAVKLLGGVWDVFLWGHDISSGSDAVCLTDNIYQALSGAAAVILPLPASVDGVTLNAPTACSQEKVALSLIADAVAPDCIVMGGRLPESFCDRLLLRGIKYFDYFDSEAFQIKNAYTTAEAALSIAMDKLQKNIRGARFAITGYGRIGKQLARLLRALDAKVTVCARKESDLTWAALDGCDTKQIENDKTLESLCHGYDVIFNTVPRWLFGEDFLTKIDPHTLMIELASAPGGIDVFAAKRLHSNVLWAASLPGKYAPESAGELIAECVESLLEKEVMGE